MLVNRLNEQIRQLKADGGNWELRLRESDERSKDFERALYENNMEKEKLSNMIKTKSN